MPGRFFHPLARLTTAVRSFFSSRHPLVCLLRVILVAWLIILGGLMLLEEKFIFVPARYPAGEWNLTPPPVARGELRAEINDVELTTTDGLQLHGWLARPVRLQGETFEPVEPLATILFLHGNGGNITNRYYELHLLARGPLQTLLIDYRGYGKSQGRPTEQGVYRDARAAYRYVRDTLGVPPERMILLGNSLGGAVAIQLATEEPVGGLVVQAGFTSIADMARIRMPYVPRFLIRSKMDSLNKVKTLTCPKLFSHGTNDHVIPCTHGQRLYEAAAEPKQFKSIPDAGHNDMFSYDPEDYINTLRTFVRQCTNTATSAKAHRP